MTGFHIYARCSRLHVVSSHLYAVRFTVACVPRPERPRNIVAIFPNFTLMTVGSFIYGLIASMIYGWIAAIIFVFFYNVWPPIAATLFGQNFAPR